METPMADHVKHKWVKLGKTVAQLLMKLQSRKYKDEKT
jgi:hypothetical protein